MDIYFPMAGQGARFGHKFKPFLTIGDETFIEAAVAPFRPWLGQIRRFVFVYLETQERDFAVSSRLATMFAGLPIECVRLASPTRGPAETIGLAVDQLQGTGPAMICDCDHALDVGPLFERFAAATQAAAVLPVWPLDPEELASWSVALVADGRAWAIREKAMPATERPGTAMGVIGCYGFADVASVTARGNALGATNYSDILREMLQEGLVVEAVPISRARFFGDPQRLERALKGSA